MGQHFLAGTGLAEQQDRALGLGDAPGLATDFHHLGAVADDMG